MAMSSVFLSRPHADPPPVRITGIRPHPPRAQARVHLTLAGAFPERKRDERRNSPRRRAASE
jgi:hypothetical protein